MDIFNWIFFAISILFYIVTFCYCIYNISEEEEDNVLVGIAANFVTIGLLFYSSLAIFNVSVSLIILWITLSLSFLLSLFIFYTFFRTEKHYYSNVPLFHKFSVFTIIALLTILLDASLRNDVIPIDGKFGLYPSVIPLIEIFFVFWVPLFLFSSLYFQKNFKLDSLKIYNGDSGYDNDNHNQYDDDLYQEYLYLLHQDNLRSSKKELYYLLDLIENRYGFSASRFFKDLIDQKRYLSYKDFINYLRYGRNLGTSSSLEKSYILENLTERLQTIIRKEFRAKNDNTSVLRLEKDIQEMQGVLLNILQNTTKIEMDSSSSVSNHVTLQTYIKEIFHSVMTPLSQIDLSWSNLVDIHDKSLSQDDENVKEQLRIIKSGVEVAKSFLYAFRQVAFYTYNDIIGDNSSIKKGIESACSIYKRENNKNDVEIIYYDLPDSILGYSNNFVLALFLPLLENAICASKQNQEVKLKYYSDDECHYFEIINPLNYPLNLSDLNKEGFSTKIEKGDTHKGIGLSVVRTLLKDLKKSGLEFNINSDNNTLLTTLKIGKNE